jgi:hypothetical protein
VLPTDSAGAMVGAPPADLVYFDDFTSGTYPDWTPTDLYEGGGFTPDPHLWPDCGGNHGRGISIYACGPNDAVGAPGVVNHSYAGLTRIASYPPDTEEPPPVEPPPEAPPPGGPGGTPSYGGGGAPTMCLAGPPQGACWAPHDLTALQVSLITEDEQP